MKFTAKQLKQIIEEELEKVLLEQDPKNLREFKWPWEEEKPAIKVRSGDTLEKVPGGEMASQKAGMGALGKMGMQEPVVAVGTGGSGEFKGKPGTMKPSAAPQGPIELPGMTVPAVPRGGGVTIERGQGYWHLAKKLGLDPRNKEIRGALRTAVAEKSRSGRSTLFPGKDYSFLKGLVDPETGAIGTQIGLPGAGEVAQPTEPMGRAAKMGFKRDAQKIFNAADGFTNDDEEKVIRDIVKQHLNAGTIGHLADEYQKSHGSERGSLADELENEDMPALANRVRKEGGGTMAGRRKWFKARSQARKIDRSFKTARIDKSSPESDILWQIAKHPESDEPGGLEALVDAHFEREAKKTHGRGGRLRGGKSDYELFEQLVKEIIKGKS